MGVWGSQCLAQTAEIVTLIGKGDSKETATANWNPATLKQKLQAGWFVRTQNESQMALLFTDRTQLRLQQNSQLQIKTVADQREWQQTTLTLQQGRAWSQARPAAKPAGSPAQGGAPLAMETPAVTLAIRGTDWDIEVDPDGRTRVVVLSGLVEVGNAYGQLQVGSGEGAIAEIGKAPTRLFLTNPRDRVQWVTAYRPQPRRWVTQPSPASLAAIDLIEQGKTGEAMAALARFPSDDLSRALLQADILIANGAPGEAVQLLAPFARDGKGEPMATALLVRTLMLAGRHEEARLLLEHGGQLHPKHEELLLVAADFAVFDGDEKTARAAYGAVSQSRPERHEGWLGLGRIELERENIALSQRWLEMARKSAPKATEPPAEMATLLTLAGDLNRAEQLFDQVLSEHPDDYVALTGRGIARLKACNPQGGLEDFLRAGVIEPRFARAWLYSGVAFYQLADTKRALEAFRKAAELDPRDPLPALMTSIVKADDMELGAAIDAARRSQKLMPYLRSLNQVLNNQKGNASLGSPLASFNLEAWATHLAAESYTPFWAGSYLFLADRQVGTFNKNSELFKGFLTDPLVFGASNRQSSIVPSPGHYGSVDITATQADLALNEVVGSVNGLSASTIPFAYFLSGTGIDGHSRIDDYTVGSHTVTAGLGVKPRHDFGFFGFAKDSQIDLDIDRMDSGLNQAKLSQSDMQADLGVNYKISATQQIWFKVGEGRQATRLNGNYYSPTTEAALDRLFQTNIFTPNGRLDPYATDMSHSGGQFRHAFGIDDSLQWHWGLESSRQQKDIATGINFAPATLSLSQRHEIETDTLWGGLRWTISDSTVILGELHGTKVRSAIREQQLLDVGSMPTMTLSNSENDESITEANPRLGIRWSPVSGQILRGVVQHWRRSAGINTLAPIETLGVTLNDRLVTAGGLYRRERLQYEIQASERTFVIGFVDHERVRNLLTPATALINDAELFELNDLRNQRLIFGTPADDYEGTPSFGEGRVNSTGLAVNSLLSESKSLAVRYVHADGQNTGNARLKGLELPYIPKHTLRTGLQLLLPNRWAVQLEATWRSKRFKDESNLKPLDAGWVFGASSHWESADKRWIFEARAENLRADKDSAKDRLAAVSAKIGYRF
jgi:tetratricopeptide (TPR) repeat protein